MEKTTWRRLKKFLGLSRGGFNTSKWETALEKVVARTEVLKQPREEYMGQLRKEIVHSLRKGQSQEECALMRAGYLITEKGAADANEIIRASCESISNRLCRIRWQRKCPEDLRTEFQNLSFAASKCLDIPELKTLKKIFEKEFGRNFVAASKDLRGVREELFEMLSTKTPAFKDKLRILNEIAERTILIGSTPKKVEDQTFFATHYSKTRRNSGRSAHALPRGK